MVSINFPYQQQQGYFAVGFYNSVPPIAAAVTTGEGTELAPADGLGEAPEPLAPPTEAVAEGSPAQPDTVEPDTGEPSPVAEDLHESELIAEPDVATADFGEPIDLDKELGLEPDAEQPAPPERL